MGQFNSVLVFMILAGTFFIQTMAARSLTGFVVSDPPMPSSSNAVSPSSVSSSAAESGEESIAEPPESMRMEKHHSSSDKSVAGGGVIIGGLVTAIFAAVYCYIRVTRKRVGETR